MSRVLFLSLIGLALATVQANASKVFLKSGVVRSGTVTVRTCALTGKLVITLRSLDKRLFQFSANRVSQVADRNKVLIRESVRLRKEPSLKSDAVLLLAKGNQVTLLGGKDGWIRVRAWGKNEGWIEERRLCDLVDF